MKEIGTHLLFAACSVVGMACDALADPIPETTSVKYFSSERTNVNPTSHRARRSFELNEEGVELIFQGNPQDGEKKMRAALEEDPNNATAIYNLAGLELANSHTARAIELMSKALEIRPNDLAFLNRLAEAYFVDSNIPKAIQIYERIVERDPSYGEAMSRLGTLYGMSKDWERAEKTLRRAVEIHPKDARAMSNLGNTLVLRGNYSEGKAVLEKAQMLLETSENAVALGIACEGLKERKEAVEHYKKAKQLGDKDAELARRLEELESLPKRASAESEAHELTHK